MRRYRGGSVLLVVSFFICIGYISRNILFSISISAKHGKYDDIKYLEMTDKLHGVNMVQNGQTGKIQAKYGGNTNNVPTIRTKDIYLQEINKRNLRIAQPLKSSALRVVDNISNVAAPVEEGVNKCDTRSLIKVMKPYRIKNRRSPSEVTFQTLHPECDHHLEYVNPPGPVTALASFPGAGNTWTRHMIQQLTGELVSRVGAEWCIYHG